SSACSSSRRGTNATAGATHRGRRTTRSSAASRRGCSPRSAAPNPALRPPPRPENALQLVGRRDLELVVAALARRLVGAPAHEDRGVAEALALHVVVLHLAHALEAQRLPREVLPGAPAALRAGHALRCVLGVRPILPRMVLQRAAPQWLELLRESAARPRVERGRDADVVQHAALVVQAEEQRPDDPFAELVPAETADHALGGARVLHLDHGALARLVGKLAQLRHHPVEARALEALEPVARD